MLKKILSISSAVLLLGYLFFAVSFISPKADENKVCQELKISIKDTLAFHYLETKDVEQLLKRAKLSPVGKEYSAINTEEMKQIIEENKLIKKAECYKTTDGSVRVNVYQRKPILRVMSHKGNYFIDSEGDVMPIPDNFTAYLPIASGTIETAYAKEQLYPFALFLQKDKFWNTQIEQIYVAQGGDVELVPRVGNHRIILGEIDNYQEKLENLKLFYDKALNKIGWNKYSTINLKYKGQVVGTLRK